MLSKRQFEEAYALRGNVTVKQLRDRGRRVYFCNCGDKTCEGWQSVNAADYWEDRAFRTSNLFTRFWMLSLMRLYRFLGSAGRR